MTAPFKARFGFDANDEKLTRLADPVDLTDGMNLQTFIRMNVLGEVDRPSDLPIPFYGAPVPAGKTYLVKNDQAGEKLEGFACWREISTELPPNIAQTGEWVWVDQTAWLRSLRTDPKPQAPLVSADVVYTTERDHEKVDVWDSTAGDWVNIYDANRIRNAIAAYTLFRGSVAEDGIAVVPPGAETFSTLPDLTSTDPGTIADNANRISQFWVFVGTDKYIVLPTDANGIGRDLAGYELDISDRIIISDQGVPGTPDLRWTVIPGDTLSKTRADGLYGDLPWQAGLWEKGSVVFYRQHLWRALRDVLPSDPAPEIIGAQMPAPSPTPAAIWIDNGNVSWPLAPTNDQWIRINPSNTITFSDPTKPFNGYSPNDDDRFRFSGDPSLTGTTTDGQIISMGWLLHPGGADWPTTPSQITMAGDVWEFIDLAGEVMTVDTDSGLPGAEVQGAIYFVIVSARNLNRPAFYMWDAGLGAWILIQTPPVYISDQEPPNPRVGDLYRPTGANEQTVVWTGLEWAPLIDAVSTVKLKDGTLAAPSLSFDSDLNLGLYHYAADVLGISAGGVLAARFDSGGIILPEGGANNVAISFGSDLDTGVYHPGDGQIAFANNGSKRHVFDTANQSMYASGWSSGYHWYSHVNSGGLRNVHSYHANDGRYLARVDIWSTGNSIGGNWEGQWIANAMCGGWGWQESFKTTIASPSGIYIAGDSSARNHINRCSASFKEKIGEAPIPNLFDRLNVTTFRWKEQTYVDENGEPLENPAPPPYDVTKTRVGFVAEELMADPLTRDLVSGEKTDEIGVDMAQLLALAVHEIKELKAKVAALEAAKPATRRRSK